MGLIQRILEKSLQNILVELKEPECTESNSLSLQNSGPPRAWRCDLIGREGLSYLWMLSSYNVSALG